MNTSRTIFSSSNGMEIPVTINLQVSPLIYAGKPVTNGRGEKIMNDKWIYVHMKGYGDCSINVNRSQFCEKVYLGNNKIKESAMGKRTPRLEKFIKEVSENFVFVKNGVTYRVFLKKNGRTFDLDYLKPYWITAHSPNLHINSIPERYKKVCILPDNALSKWAHELKVDTKKAFGFDEN